MADVFVSYCREDQALVARFIGALQRLGLSTSHDELFERGEDFEDRILSEIRSAGAVVVCWSEAAAKSKWVRDEAREAQRQKKYLGCQIATGGAGFGFDTINHDDLTRWEGDTRDLRFLGLVSQLGKALGRAEIAALESAEQARIAEDERKQRDAEEERQRQAEVARQLKAARTHAEQEREAYQRRRELERQWSFEQKALVWLRPYCLLLHPLVVAFVLEALRWYVVSGNGLGRNDDIFVSFIGPLMNYELSFKIVLGYAFTFLLWQFGLKPEPDQFIRWLIALVLLSPLVGFSEEAFSGSWSWR